MSKLPTLPSCQGDLLCEGKSVLPVVFLNFAAKEWKQATTRQQIVTSRDLRFVEIVDVIWTKTYHPVQVIVLLIIKWKME
jgi:hypothetical protein